MKRHVLNVMFIGGIIVVAMSLVSSLVIAQILRNPETSRTPNVSVGTAFTYQGVLNDNDMAANGVYDLRFKLFDAADGGQEIGLENLVADKDISDGLFTTELDFGAVFTGTARYLEIGVRPGDSTGTYETLLPRQQILPAPYAMHADVAVKGPIPELQYFEIYQYINTANARDWESFEIDGEIYLAAASYFSSDYNTDSTIYQWDGDSFVTTQTIPTIGASHWDRCFPSSGQLL